MSVLFHIAEIAALLALSYAFGLGLGYGARRLSLGNSGLGTASIPVERLAAAKGEAPPPRADEPSAPPPEAVVALAGALATPDPPLAEFSAASAPGAGIPQESAVAPAVAAEAVPAPVFPAELNAQENPPEAALLALARDELAAPPSVAPEASVILAESSAVTVAAAAPDEGPRRQPQASVEAAPPSRPTPPAQPPEGWSVVSRRAEEVPAVSPSAAADTARGPAAPSSRPGVAWTGEIRGRAAPASEMRPEPEPEPEREPEPETPVEPMVAESAPAVETPSPPVSEWGTRTPPAAPADLGQAVAAAQSAVEAALIRSGIDPGAPAVRDSAAFGKPDPMKSPLGGGRDDLKLIDGLRAEDELMLNGIGIFHFGQIAEWDHKEILWLENHILERGRISRENWQAQAAELIRRRGEETRQVGA